ncbi:MAG: DUF642 domain-containing protein [Sphingomonadaceae bacterium]
MNVTRLQFPRAKSVARLAIAVRRGGARTSPAKQPAAPPPTAYLPAAGQANIVQNGNFETPPAETPRTGQTPEPFKRYAKGETFGGWTVDPNAEQSIVHVGTLWQAASGQQSVLLSDSGAGAIFQDVPTTPGQTYRLRFAISGSTASGSAGPVKRMQVSFGDTVLPEFQFDVRNVPGGHSNQNMGWRYEEVDVVATAATTRLRFASLNLGAGDGPVVDDVSLTLPGQPTPPPTDGVCPPGAPFFPETGFCIDNPDIQAYFQGRGGVTTFGFPVSRTVSVLGFPAQFFQGAVLRIHPDGVKPMNLLDPGTLPVTTINFSTFPAHDEALATSAPLPDTPNYAAAVLSHLQANVPDSFEGVPVNFLQSYLAAGGGDQLVALEVWGFPTSRPARDPNNANFIYQRFQRAILQFDASTGLTERILLADFLKQVITNNPTLLPADLRAQVEAQGNPFFNQYCPNNPNWLCRPAELPDTNLTSAFETQRQ